MFTSKSVCMLVLTATLFVPYSVASVFAEDAAAWRVMKSTGAVWMTTADVQQASLTNEAVLKPGDTIRTGANGRVLLMRGEASMLIAPNSVISLPAEQKDGLSTTIYEQAGSVLFQAEKRNFKHFQVETPYLAAVVKGTQFRVTLNKRGAGVEVLGGQVEVTDFKTGQYALVLPGQRAKVSDSGRAGLFLSGTQVGPVKQGTPRAAPFNQIFVPKGGLAAPAGAPDGKTIVTLRMINDNSSGEAVTRDQNIIRITAPIGEVTLDVAKSSNGLAHGSAVTGIDRNNKASNQTIWTNGALTPGNGASQSVGQGNSNASGNINAGAMGAAGSNASATGMGINSAGSANAVSGNIAIGSANGGNAAAVSGTAAGNANGAARGRP